MARSLRSDRALTGSREALQPEPDARTLGFVGSGRAAGALARSLARRGNRVFIARQGDSAARLAEDLGADLLPPEQTLSVAGVTILAVPDGQVAALATRLARNALPGDGRVVLHLSGSLGLEPLAPLARRGYAPAAMHPLQVLSGRRIPPGTIYAVEAPGAAHQVVKQLVADLGGVEIELAPGTRPAYHAAAVMAANLGMTLLAEAVDLMEQAGIDRNQALHGLAGLVRGGLEASLDAGLPAALTGPVTRGDVTTLAAHMEALRADPDLLSAYVAVSRLALRQARKDGRPATGAAAVAELLKES
jgi:predicted short-subunit dehydrogenase-like oxidoreductase (DUF2520 family)